MSSPIVLLCFQPWAYSRFLVLPTKIHPSWPLGRPLYLSHPSVASFGQVSLNNARGRTAPEVQRLLGRLGLGTSSPRLHFLVLMSMLTAPNALRNTRTIWSDWGLKSSSEDQNGIFVGIVEDESREEIAPGMAVSFMVDVRLQEQLSPVAFSEGRTTISNASVPPNPSKTLTIPVYLFQHLWIPRLSTATSNSSTNIPSITHSRRNGAHAFEQSGFDTWYRGQRLCCDGTSE